MIFSQRGVRLQEYQEEFIAFAISHNVLQFGEFELKSGRKSPWFFNSGKFNTGQALSRLGHFYGEACVAAELQFDMLFGPAYKGIPLVAATAIALANDHDLSIPYTFNRKETKDHGEKGDLVGAALQGRVLIVDDVITAGTAIQEAMTIISGSDAKLAGVLIAVDREERGSGTLSAITEVEQRYGVPVISVIKSSHIRDYLARHDFDSALIKEMTRYNEKYGTLQEKESQ